MRSCFVSSFYIHKNEQKENNIVQLSEKEQYIMKRKRKKLRLVDIARQIGCCHSLLSKYENDVSLMSDKKIKQYQEIIDR